MTDVDYRDTTATAALLTFADWPDEHPASETTAVSTIAAPYRSGSFFERELPCLLPVVSRACREQDVDVVVVDGYADLGGKPGLGAHLHAALSDEGIEVAVVGVAKNPFKTAGAMPVLRGASTRPLFVSAVGVAVTTAAEWVTAMHGPHRLPTLLRRVDHLARGWS